MMSIPSLFRTYSRSKPDAATSARRPPASRSGRIAGLALLARRFRRNRKARASYLNTGHLNEHVRKDIGLEHTDLTPPE